MKSQQTGTVTLDQFAKRVGCHFTTASRLKSGERLPGRALLGSIIEAYNLDPQETMRLYTNTDDDARDQFGKYLKKHVFGEDD